MSEILILTPQPYDDAQVAAAKKRAEDLLARIRGGKSFSEVATAHSEGPTAAYGGQMGTYARGELAPAIEAVVFAMKPGEISDVLRSKQGFLILHVTARLPATIPNAVYETTLPPDLRDYWQVARAILDRAWYGRMISSGLSLKRNATAFIGFQLNRDGHITNTRLISSSGEPSLDHVALRTIQSSGPLPAFPASAKENYIKVRCRFEYQASSNKAKTDNSSR